MDLSKSEYEYYFDNLIKGKRPACAQVLDTLISRNFTVQNIYQHLMQRSLYQVGNMWEYNQISVATEHLATATTESLMHRVYENIPAVDSVQKTVVITSIENETHHIGGKMVADVFEMHGWEAIYLGGNTPAMELVEFLRETEPDVVGLSVSVYFHMNTLVKTVEILNEEFKSLKIIIGGQAFQKGGQSIAERFENSSLALDFQALEQKIDQLNNEGTKG